MSVILSQFDASGITSMGPIAVTQTGYIYTQDYNSKQIRILDLNGNQLSIISTSDFYKPFIIDYSNNKIYCAGVGSFGTINLTNNTFSSVGSAWLNGLVIGSDGFVYATTNNEYKIQKITPSTGAQTNIFTSTGAIQSETSGTFGGITTDNDGFLYCITRGSGYIYKFNTSGTLIGLFARVNSAYGNMFAITYDTYNNVFYALSTGTPGGIYRIDKYGSSTLYATTIGPSYGIFYDKFTARLYATSETNARICVIRPFVPPTGTTYSLNNKNLLNYYPFNIDMLNYANPNNPVSDTTSNLVTISTATTILNGSTGAASFPGSSGNFININKLKFAGKGITISTWAKYNYIANGFRRILDFRNTAGNHIIFGIFDGGRIELHVSGSSYHSTDIIDFNWHNYCILIDANSNVSLYIDGVIKPLRLEGTGPIVTSFNGYFPASAEFVSNFIGHSNFGPNDQLNGFIDNFFIFDRVFTSDEIAATSNINNTIIVEPEYPCFLEGSKILRLNIETDEEEYIAVEKLRRGDLIKTATCGYKAIAHIGRATLHNPKNDSNPKNRIYSVPSKKHGTLSLTGEHCLLYKESEITPKKRKEVREHMGDDYITEIYHRVPVCLDERAVPYEGCDGPVTIWHFALEHNNLYNNHAVYANGILVETCSIDFLMNYTSMTLV